MLARPAQKNVIRSPVAKIVLFLYGTLSVFSMASARTQMKKIGREAHQLKLTEPEPFLMACGG